MLAPSDPETDPHIQQAQQTTDTQLVSAHPSTLFFYLIFKAAALGIYIFGWLFTTQYILSFVAIILCLAFDFWTVKNIAGRLLVGLRYTSCDKDGGTKHCPTDQTNGSLNHVHSKPTHTTHESSGRLFT